MQLYGPSQSVSLRLEEPKSAVTDPESMAKRAVRTQAGIAKPRELHEALQSLLVCVTEDGRAKA